MGNMNNYNTNSETGPVCGAGQNQARTANEIFTADEGKWLDSG